MSRSRPHVVAIVLALALAGCGAGRQPQLKVLSVEAPAARPRDMVLFVEVMNPAGRPLELQRLQYRFERSAHVAGVAPVHGEVALARTVDAGAAIVVEVPLPIDDALRGQELTLAGRLYATQDDLERSFAVHAHVSALR
jgi:hypothetical protein